MTCADKVCKLKFTGRGSSLGKAIILITGGPIPTIHVLHNYLFRCYEEFFDEVHVLYWNYCDNYKTNAVNKLVAHSRTFKRFNAPLYFLWVMKSLSEVIKRLRKKRFKVVLYATGVLWPGLPSAIVGKFFRVPVFLTITSHMLEYMRLEDKHMGKSELRIALKIAILTAIHHIVFRLSDKITAISRSIEREVMSFGLPRRKVLYIPLSVDTNHFILKSSLKIGDEFKVLYVGQIKYMKGIMFLLEAISQLTKEIDIPVRLLVAGKPIRTKDLRFAQKIKSKIARYNLSATFLGFKHYEELPEVYREADVFVLPSLSEGMPSVLMEAMACGVPSISSNVSGAKDIINHGINGFLVSPCDSAKIKEYLKILLLDMELRKKFSGNARKTILRINKDAYDKHMLIWED